MINHFNEPVKQNSTATVKVVLYDENGYKVTPTTLRWTLTKSDGTTVINSRSNVSVTVAPESRVVMSGADLAAFAGDDKLRLVKLVATYSSTDGANLPWELTVSFYIE